MIQPSYPPEEAKGVWVWLEHEAGRLSGVSLELLGQGRKLADTASAALTAVILGRDLLPLAQEAVRYGADEVLAVEHPLLEPYTADPSTKVLTGLVLERKPDVLLLGATANGRDLAGRLAVRLRTGLTADCTDLSIDAATGLLSGEVTGFGQGILATIQCPRHRPQMATVRPGVFPRPAAEPGRQGRIEQVQALLSNEDARVRVVKRSLRKGVDITQAEKLVVGGRGVQGDFGLVRALAKALGAEVGATRVAVDLGWIGHERMVGQTGSVTRPKLAIVCGASGAMQFTVGIQEAETVVAINSDPQAPIFDSADYCIADDLFQVLPPLIEGLKREKTAGRR